MVHAAQAPLSVIEQLLDAVNRHDLAAVVACFAGDYTNQTPAHPQRGFRGQEQVRRNWTQILTDVPDVQASVPRAVADGATVWSEWRMTGTRRSDAAPFEMAGVVIYEVADGLIQSAALYLEPVEQASGDIDAAVRRVTADPTHRQETS